MSDALVPARQAITGSALLMYTPVAALSREEQLIAWSALDLMEKAIAERKGELRERLLQDAIDHGEEKTGKVPEAVHKVLKVLDGEVKREYRKGKVTFNGLKVEALLKKKGIDPTKGGDYVFTPDEKKITALLEAELITVDELDSVADVSPATFAFKVKKPKGVIRMFEEAKDEQERRALRSAGTGGD